MLSTFSIVQSLEFFFDIIIYLKWNLCSSFLALYWKTLLIAISSCFEKLTSQAFVVIILGHFAVLYSLNIETF